MTYGDIIDNQSRQLSDEINDRLQASRSVKFATGYLYLSGFYEIADALAPLEEARILVGDTLNRETVEALAQAIPGEEELAAEVDARRYEQFAERLERVAKVEDGVRGNVAGLPHSLTREQQLARLAALIRDGRIRIRVYTRDPLHAKAYIFRFKPAVAQGAASEGLGIVGSSNLTLSGFRRNTELNTYVRGQKSFDELNAWFDRLWDEAVPFEETLRETLEDSWALKTVSPYDIYVMTLYHLVASSLARQTEQIWFWTDGAFMDRLRARFDGFQDLYDFQKVAIMQAATTIARYDGVFISDVVGLGKTFVGAGLLKQLGRRAVILCPAGLQPMWQDFAERFEVDARVVSQGMLYRGVYDEESVLYPYEDRPVVLIDESHNFRNDDTKRYEELQPFLADKTVILMTATPQNTSVWNIYNQIKLFHQDERNIFPVEGSNLREIFRAVEAGTFRLQALLKYVLIRRTRAHIRAYYQRAGQRTLTFPERRVETVAYDINALYDDLYDEILDLLQRLTYARYNLWTYVREAKQDVAPYVDLRRVMGTLKVFHKIRLFRRLESSIAAFRQSIANLLGVHRRFVAIIEERGIVPAGEEIQDRIYRYDRAQLQDYLDKLAGERPYRTEDFRIRALLRDLRHDVAVLEEIQTTLHGIPGDLDPKYEALRDQVRRLQADHPKVLIFSEFADTVTYVYERLAADFDDVAFITGDTKGRLLETIGAFAPRANPYRGDRRIDLLVATDVLSEGHNLQDCSAVVNYDLHWNPVRLIQRAGRVDRIGSEAETIQVRNFLPVDRVEAEINIRETLRARIAEIHRYIGEDAQILEADEQLNEAAMYTIYDTRDMDALEAGEDVGFTFDEAENLIRQLEDSEPAYMRLIKDLQLGLRSAKAEDAGSGTYAFFRQGDFPKLFIRWADGEITDDFSAVVEVLRCAPDCEEVAVGEVQRTAYYEALDALKAHFKAVVAQGQVRGRMPAPVRRAKRRLARCVAALDGQELRANADKIDRVLTATFPRQFLAELRRINARDLSEREYFNRLVGFYNRHNLGSLAEAETAASPSDAPVEFVCGEILV